MLTSEMWCWLYISSMLSAIVLHGSEASNVTSRRFVDMGIGVTGPLRIIRNTTGSEQFETTSDRRLPALNEPGFMVSVKRNTGNIVGISRSRHRVAKQISHKLQSRTNQRRSATSAHPIPSSSLLLDPFSELVPHVVRGKLEILRPSPRFHNPVTSSPQLQLLAIARKLNSINQLLQLSRDLAAIPEPSSSFSLQRIPNQATKRLTSGQKHIKSVLLQQPLTNSQRHSMVRPRGILLLRPTTNNLLTSDIRILPEMNFGNERLPADPSSSIFRRRGYFHRIHMSNSNVSTMATTDPTNNNEVLPVLFSTTTPHVGETESTTQRLTARRLEPQSATPSSTTTMFETTTMATTITTVPINTSTTTITPLFLFNRNRHRIINIMDLKSVPQKENDNRFLNEIPITTTATRRGDSVTDHRQSSIAAVLRDASRNEVIPQTSTMLPVVDTSVKSSTMSLADHIMGEVAAFTAKFPPTVSSGRNSTNSFETVSTGNAKILSRTITDSNQIDQSISLRMSISSLDKKVMKEAFGKRAGGELQKGSPDERGTVSRTKPAFNVTSTTTTPLTKPVSDTTTTPLIKSVFATTTATGDTTSFDKITSPWTTDSMITIAPRTAPPSMIPTTQVLTKQTRSPPIVLLSLQVPHENFMSPTRPPAIALVSPQVPQHNFKSATNTPPIALPSSQFPQENLLIASELKEELNQNLIDDVPSTLTPPTSVAKKSTSSVHHFGAPGAAPPSDSVVNELNSADDFMEVARRLSLFRERFTEK